MPTANKLNDTQLVILGTAAERRNKRVLPVPKTVKVKGAALSCVLDALLQHGLINADRVRSEAASVQTA